MKWFYDLKTRSKLLFTFGAMGVFLVLVAWLGMSGMNDLDGALVTLVERDFVGASELGLAQASFARVGRTVRQLVIDTEEDKMQQDARDLEQHIREYRDHLAAAEKTIIRAETVKTQS